jgi:hypothetical protein
MKLKEFLLKNKINLPEPVFSLCNEGIEIMQKSVDPIHDENHLFRIFQDLDRFLRENSQIDKSEIDFKMLLLATCWHDVWKSERFPTNAVSLVLDQMQEGLGSAKMFTRKAKEEKLEPKLISLTKYAIRKHARFQMFPIQTREAKILKDLDRLEEWSLERLKHLKKRHLTTGRIDPRLLRLAKFWFFNFMAKVTDSSFHFEWSKTEFLKRKKAYFEEVNKLLLKYGSRL